MRRIFLLLSLLIATVLPLEARAADSHAAAAADAQPAPPAAMQAPRSQGSDAPADAEASPWENPFWNNATATMRLYVCDYARRPPSWCSDVREPPSKATLPDTQGPPLIDEDAQWLAFLEHVDPAQLSEDEVAFVRQRASRRRDPQAMEILGYLYAEGLSVPRDYVEAYRWYGLAYLAGEKRVRPNMDIVWQQLQRHDLEGAMRLAREFDSLAAGEVPASLQAPPVGAPAPDSPLEKPAGPAAAPAGGDSAGSN